MLKYLQTYLLFINICGQGLILASMEKIRLKKCNCFVTIPTKPEKTAKEIFSDPDRIM